MEKGRFNLFALFLRDDSPGKWDVVVSAYWIVRDKKESLEHIVRKMVKKLTKQELMSLWRIVLTEPEDDRVKTINKSFHVQHGRVEVKDSDLFGLQITHAFIITSQFLKPETVESAIGGE